MLLSSVLVCNLLAHRLWSLTRHYASICGMTQIAARSLEPVGSMSFTPGQHLASVSGKGSLQDSSDTELQSMVGAEEGEWTDVLSRRSKQKKGDERSSSGSDGSSTVCSLRVTTPTVVFSPANPDRLITKLSSIKVSRALELLCLECIMAVRLNYRLNLSQGIQGMVKHLKPCLMHGTLRNTC